MLVLTPRCPSYVQRVCRLLFLLYSRTNDVSNNSNKTYSTLVGIALSIFLKALTSKTFMAPIQNYILELCLNVLLKLECRERI